MFTTPLQNNIALHDAKKGNNFPRQNGDLKLPNKDTLAFKLFLSNQRNLFSSKKIQFE